MGLSAAKENKTLHFLTDTHGIADYFAHRFGIADHYAAGKVARGKTAH
ncbi:MAG: hypothetical protein R3B54_00120 [Bdellovibrionota bacterium]